MIGSFQSPILNSHEMWRITDSNRWPPACKAGALASWANPPDWILSFELVAFGDFELFNLELIQNSTIQNVRSTQFKIPNSLRSSPRQTWTADLHIISVAL